MPYRISKQNILNHLPDSEKGPAEQVGQRLLDQAGGKCYLCWGRLLPASELLVADHVKPQAEGGKTELSNLRLVHLPCNSAKKDRNPLDVIPYLRLKRFVQEKGGQLNYGDVTEHFEIAPGETQIEDSGSALRLDFCDGTSVEVPTIADFSGDTAIRYSFVQVPRRAIFNDVVQPRSIRLEHVNAIFLDLGQNPLHEPPSCRTDPSDKSKLKRLRMFDGQHKTIASWMRERKSITIKLYLDMTETDANKLVIAIQDRVKKLSLTPFESAAKMADEWKDRIENYVDEMKGGNKEVSEAGYIEWLPRGKQRTDGTAALKNALLQQILDDKTFRLASFVDPPGKKKVTGLTQSMIKTRFLTKLLVTSPSDDPIAKSDDERARAVGNIVWMTNVFLEALLDNSGGEVQEDVIADKKARLFNQITLEQVAELLRMIFVREAKIADKAQLSADLSNDARSEIEQKILWLASHSRWSADWQKDSNMQTLREAHAKNQNREKAFNGIAFDVGYATMGQEYPAYRNIWILHGDVE